MKFSSICSVLSVALIGVLPLCAEEGSVKEQVPEQKKQEKYVVGSQKSQVTEIAQAKTGGEKTSAPATTQASPKKTTPVSSDTKKNELVVIARVVEIPGKFAPNDLYNYVYVMKYRVIEVVSGKLEPKDIYVGHYNPLIPRAQIKDKMASVVKGNVEKIEVGGKHRLTLASPIEKYWNDATEDEYIDVEDDVKFFALQADVVK